MTKNRCPLCPKSFQSYKDLKRHMEKIHDGSMSEEDCRKITLGDCVKKG